VRNRTHWNSTNVKPVDPVSLGLVTQLELDALVKKASEKKAREDAKRRVDQPEGPALLSASESEEQEIEAQAEAEAEAEA